MIALLTILLGEEEKEVKEVEENLRETQLVRARSVSMERMFNNKPQFDKTGKPVMRYQTVTITQGNTGPGHLLLPH